MNTQTPPRVYIFDPHPLMLQGVEGAFRQAGLRVVGASTDPSGVLEHPDEAGPAIHFVDHSPGTDYGTQLISGLIHIDPTRRVVATSSLEHLSMIASAYEAGASAFVPKQAPADRVVEVILAVHALPHPRDRHYPNTLATALADYYIGGGRADASPRRVLTRRQLEIFLLVAEGLSIKDVAEKLQLSTRTVGNHLLAAQRRLNIPRAHFRSFAIEHRLLAPPRAHPPPEGDRATGAA